MGVELFQADRWTDMTKLIVVFHNFVNEPKKLCVRTVSVGRIIPHPSCHHFNSEQTMESDTWLWEPLSHLVNSELV